MTDSIKTKPLCLVTGVGDATGRSVVTRFIDGGYKVAMIARNAKRIDEIAKQHNHAYAFCCDVSDLEALEQVVNQIQESHGPVSVLVHNAVSHTFGTFLDSDPREMERNFRVNTTALLYLARWLSPDMIARKNGAIVCTGNTASYRGVPNYALFAPTKAAQRVLCESMARDLGPKRVHVAYVSVDAAIDVTWIEEIDGENPDWLTPPDDWPWPREDFYTNTHAIADEIFHIAHQHYTAWSFETVIRPFAEKW